MCIKNILVHDPNVIVHNEPLPLVYAWATCSLWKIVGGTLL